MTAVWSYCCSWVERSSNSSAACLSAPLALLGCRDRHHEVCASAAIDDALRGLLVLAEFPVVRRVLVRGIQDRALEEGVAHVPPTGAHGAWPGNCPSSSCTPWLPLFVFVGSHFRLLLGRRPTTAGSTPPAPCGQRQQRGRTNHSCTTAASPSAVSRGSTPRTRMNSCSTETSVGLKSWKMTPQPGADWRARSTRRRPAWAPARSTKVSTYPSSDQAAAVGPWARSTPRRRRGWMRAIITSCIFIQYSALTPCPNRTSWAKKSG